MSFNFYSHRKTFSPNCGGFSPPVVVAVQLLLLLLLFYFSLSKEQSYMKFS